MLGMGPRADGTCTSVIRVSRITRVSGRGGSVTARCHASGMNVDALDERCSTVATTSRSSFHVGRSGPNTARRARTTGRTPSISLRIRFMGAQRSSRHWCRARRSTGCRAQGRACYTTRMASAHDHAHDHDKEFLSRNHRLYIGLAAVFVSSLLVGDLIGGKFVRVLGHTISAGTFVFPVTFVMTDIINEFYGKKGARFVTLVAMMMVIYAFLILQVAIRAPISADSPIPQAAFQGVFGIGVVLFVSSLTAFLIGQLCDIYVFHTLRGITASKHLWLRATGSTAISQLVDTVVINVGLRYGGAGMEFDLVDVIMSSYVLKLFIAVGLTPAGKSLAWHQSRGAGVRWACRRSRRSASASDGIPSQRSSRL